MIPLVPFYECPPFCSKAWLVIFFQQKACYPGRYYVGKKTALCLGHKFLIQMDILYSFPSPLLTDHYQGFYPLAVKTEQDLYKLYFKRRESV